jgi:hypothetical protein
MPRTDISRLPDESRIWIFPISPALDEARASDVVSRVDAFLDSWAAHNTPIVSGRDLIDGTFLVIAVDRQSETSGCSIDRMFGVLKALEREHGVAILDPNRIFRRSADGAVESVSREAFRESGRSDTPVFDILSERLGDVRSGRWEKAAAESWHRSLLKPA